MFRLEKERREDMHKHLHIGASLKKAVKWYLDNAAESFVWSSKPFDYRHK